MAARGTRLYVGNLAYSTTEEGLREAFARDGRRVKSVFIATDRETGRPRGFGFVEMETPEDTSAAISAMEGFSLDGRTLKVNEAREREGGGGGGGGGRRPGGGGGGGGYRGGGDRGGDRGPPPGGGIYEREMGGGGGGDAGGGRRERGRGDRDRDRDRDRGDRDRGDRGDRGGRY
jgi:cold-inducible RNA-binding protein